MPARLIILLLLGITTVTQAKEINGASDDAKCRHYDPLRTAFFGDLHIHTTLSLDASMQGTITRPVDAYRYARGEAIGIPPYRDNGEPVSTAQISRPLDFAGVTDHAEMLGENHICMTPGEEGHNSLWCYGLRWIPNWVGLVFAKTAADANRLGFCGEDGEICRQAAKTPWMEIQDAAAAALDQSDECSFTSFVAYEWTGAGSGGDGLVANLHRNVVFRGAEVPELPPSFVESKNAATLYRQLEDQCRNGLDNCDAVVIPHNSNISLGLMFRDAMPDGSAMTTADARLKARYETLVEMIQHKGASECYYGPTPVMPQDELCDFEQLPWNSFTGNTLKSRARAIEPGAGMVREVLHQGLQADRTLGENPFQFGFIGSTDTHRSLSGGVEEYNFQGHGGAGNAAAEEGAPGLPDQWEFNPGGLAVLYAEENTRDALFDAMQRREAYATSGPRMQVRFFAGEALPEDLCQQPDMIATAYAGGVPMGGELSGLTDSPRFLVSASRDPGVADHPGTDLQRIQLIKGWIDSKGQSQQQIFEVAGDPENGASVDLASCETTGRGFEQLCTVWRDPDFNPAQRAFYYARVVENPTCRWSTRICNAQQIDCSDVDNLDEDTAMCCSTDMPRTIQERAWTSPIWHTPG